MTYNFTWPSEKNMKHAKVFSAGIYRQKVIDGHTFKSAPFIWITGETELSDTVRDRVHTVINQLQAGIYQDGPRIDLIRPLFNAARAYHQVNERNR